MRLDLGFGETKQVLELDDGQLVAVLEANETASGHTDAEALRWALDHPIGSESLVRVVKPGERIAIITSDTTRPMPTAEVMPVLLDELYAAGVHADDITLHFALGSHRAHTEAERRALAGERAWSELTCRDTDPNDVVRVGETSYGTPIDIDREVYEADRRICLGNIEFHYFAGYSGGAKAIMPGCSTPAAIQANHAMMTNPLATAGRLAGNPVREDVEEAARVVGVDFILNVVLDENKRIAGAVAGDVVAAHRRGCEMLDELYRVKLEHTADIVIASQGGAPKDVNLYQAQKALDSAARAVSDGGVVILVGACPEGFGSARFEEWLLGAEKPEQIVERIEQDFQLGGHKAAAMALVMRRAEIYLVSQMDDEIVRRAHMRPFTQVQEALDHALAAKGFDASVVVIPHAGSIFPEGV